MPEEPHTDTEGLQEWCVTPADEELVFMDQEGLLDSAFPTQGSQPTAGW